MRRLVRFSVGSSFVPAFASAFVSAFVLGGALLAGCDLQPPPKKQAPGGAPPPGVPVPRDAGTAPADVAAPPADAAFEVSAPCLDVSAHIASVLIAGTADPTQKAALVQDRTKIIRRSAEACTRDAWSDAARACFTGATTVEAMQACGANLKAP